MVFKSCIFILSISLRWVSFNHRSSYYFVIQCCAIVGPLKHHFGDFEKRKFRQRAVPTRCGTVLQGTRCYTEHRQEGPASPSLKSGDHRPLNSQTPCLWQSSTPSKLSNCYYDDHIRSARRRGHRRRPEDIRIRTAKARCHPGFGCSGMLFGRTQSMMRLPRFRFLHHHQKYAASFVFLRKRLTDAEIKDLFLVYEGRERQRTFIRSMLDTRKTGNSTTTAEQLRSTLARRWVHSFQG